MTNRIKLPVTVISRARAEEILGEIAGLKLEHREQTNALDCELTAARKKYEQPLVTLGKQIEEKTAVLERWASENSDQFEKGRKSIDMLHGVLGYRTGTPKLKTLSKWTWERVLSNLKALGKPVAGFIRTKEEVNKDAILNAHSAGYLLDNDARQLGVQIVQDESFFVEPKLEDQASRTVAFPTKEAA